MKLKVFKGTCLMVESAIIDLPTGLVTFYMDTNDPRTPAVAVASGPFIYVYKNLRPYFKFTLPPLDVNPIEQDLWHQVCDKKIDVKVLREMLESLQKEGSEGSLTVRSLKFLQLDEDELEAFAQLHKAVPLKRQTVITCITTIKKSLPDDDAISCLVVGTESHEIYILDPEAFTVLSKMSVASVPVFISVSGLYDVEFRLAIACRDGNIYILKKGGRSLRHVIEVASQIVGLERTGKTLVVGCINNSLVCFSSKGRKLWCVYLPHSITTMTSLNHKAKGFKAVLVGLKNCEVRLYKEKFLISTLQVDSPVTAMQYGRFGREDSSLIVVTLKGGIYVKILKRTASFEEKDIISGPPPAQSVKLNIPKKTKLFVDQSLRERENSINMHQIFQRDICLLRLRVARAYVSALEKSLNPVSSGAESIKVSAHVQGFGPAFKLTIKLQNTSFNSPSTDLFISFHYPESLYNLSKSCIPVPLLIPGIEYIFETFVECISDKGIADIIKVFVLHKGNSVPIITAVINMPVSEALVTV
ncbi:Bardet-Biedl syndrome 1 protein-like isoform X2 [Xenia sp. Carnegie-2017]|nr:Bardet-Biedl syndrome 1 protein-like isoform X2 [Xenia sp. Carnegie-2017]